ncbi:hypothetical protein EON67_05155, partial [archaeon]
MRKVISHASQSSSGSCADIGALVPTVCAVPPLSTATLRARVRQVHNTLLLPGRCELVVPLPRHS